MITLQTMCRFSLGTALLLKHSFAFCAFQGPHCLLRGAKCNLSNRRLLARNVPSPLRTASTDALTETEANEKKQERPWMNHGLLISSFSDGIVPNEQAKTYLARGLVWALLTEQRRNAEQFVESSVIASPCNGPNILALNSLEQIDEALSRVWSSEDPASLLPPAPPPLRFLYIPTAMYALRPESNSTPGRQRQRARADGKKRRNDIVKVLSEIVPAVCTVTLDLDDGSIKQPEITTGYARDDFPVTGKEALTDWSPHFAYVQGGNTFWLYHCIEKGGWRDDLIQRLTSPDAGCFYMGSSAGAIVMGASVETACWKGWDDPSIVPGLETYQDWKAIAGLRLTGDLSFFSHHDEDQWSSVVQERQPELGQDAQVYCLGEEDVCYVDGSSRTITMLL